MLATNQRRHGNAVTITGREGVWYLLDRSPKPAHWWLHRWENGEWITTEQHPRNLELIHTVQAELIGA